MSNKTINIFISYSHEDDIWLSEYDKDDKEKKNKKYLLDFWQRTLREKNVKFWYDREANEGIRAGVNWKNKIFEEIDKADIAILFITQDFVVSQFIREEELPRILERNKKDELEVLPIYLELANWKEIESIEAYQVIPSRRTPYCEYFTDSSTNWKKIRNDIADGLKAVVERVEKKKMLIPIAGSDENGYIKSINGSKSKEKQEKANYKKYLLPSVAIISIVVFAFIIWNFLSKEEFIQNNKLNKSNNEIKTYDKSNELSNNNEPAKNNNVTKIESQNATINNLPLSNNNSGKIVIPEIKQIENSILVGNISDAEKILNELKNGSTQNINETFSLKELENRIRMLKKMAYIPSLNLYVDKYEVTVSEYSSFIQDYNNRNPKSKLSMPQLSGDLNGNNQPVQYISYDEAYKYAAFYKKRLPTLDEWKTFLNLMGNDNFLFGKSNPYEYGNLSGKNGNDRWTKTTSPVGSFKPNKYGIYDLIGNVEEWCSDPTSKSDAYVVGGFIGSKPEDLTVEKLAKDVRYSSVKYFDVGFRCVYDPKKK